MAVSVHMRKRLRALKTEYNTLQKGKASLLALLDEVELPESVYNSNAIENSTLTLRETEKILLEMEVSREVSVREIFEAKNLARVMNYIRTKSKEKSIDRELMLFLHQMLIGGINDDYAGRFRTAGEYVRVGTHVAPAPERIEHLIGSLLLEYTENTEAYFLEKIAKFHLDFETIHPFCDGNGRIGRVLMNYQMFQLGFPPVIIRDKEKAKYYQTFGAYRSGGDTSALERVVLLALMESLHKRIAYMKGGDIVTLSQYAKQHDLSPSGVSNAARHQTIPAFREKGVWKIGA